MGSCFADFIGSRLSENKLRVATNPFGIIYHPLALLRVLDLALKAEFPARDTFVQNQGIWYNYLFHGSIADDSLEKLESVIEQKLSELRSILNDVEFLLLTFGTAVQYQLAKSGLIVANCHKVPQKSFEKSLTTPDQIAHMFSEFYSSWGQEKPQIILSVSPIRHIKEGIERNCASKSVLRVACEQILDKHSEINYFPGFEIMMDDLRDYRFFEKDMIHPNDTARDYIWDLFSANYLDNEARNFIEQWQRISRNLAHRPFHPSSSNHQEFIKKTLQLIEQLPENVDVSKEVAALKKDLI
jgi:hypothetical protein